MKNKFSTTLFKIIPIASISLLVACSSPEKGAGEKVVDQSTQHTAKDKVETIISESKADMEKTSTIVEDAAFTDTLETDVTDVAKVEEVKSEMQNVSSEKMTKEIAVNIDKEVDKSLSHSTWNDLLQKHVSSNGKVNYKGLKSDKVKLENYLLTIKENAPTSDWSKNEKLAYWINVYNAFTVKLIVDNYPLKSITDLDKPWDKKWIDIDGKTYSLGNVENDILRKMGESRIHFAINCASFSCPNLLNEAFTADKLSAQLRKVTKDFFNDETKNELTDGDLKVSKLFEWYAIDFSNGDIIGYINKYSGKTISPDSKLSYLEYSWKLNE